MDGQMVAKSSYGQYCPISRASEILAERWTLVVVRNLLLGCTTFNAIAGGVPGMSRSLLSARLRSLEEAGVIHCPRKAGRRGKVYQLTEAGQQLLPVIEAMTQWGQRWVELQPEHSDPSFVLWAWVHVHLQRERLPERRVVVRFDFPDQRPPHHRFWILFDGERTELCYSHPKYPHQLHVTAQSAAFTQWHIGHLSWGEALRREQIRIEGPPALARARQAGDDRRRREAARASFPRR